MNTSSTFATGNGGGRGWNTSAYPTQSTNSGTAGVQYLVSTVGYHTIKLSFDHRASGTASRWSQVDYTLNGGTNWTTGFWNNGGGLSPHDTFYSFNDIDFSSVSDANNNANFGVRIVSIFSPLAFSDGLGNDFNGDEAYHRARVSGGSVYGPAGTWRFDNVTFEGQAIPEPSSMALMGLAGCLGLVGFLRKRRKALLARQQSTSESEPFSGA